MKKKDVILVLSLLFISVAGMIAVHSRRGGDTVYVYSQGELFGTYDLSGTESVHIDGNNGYENDIRIENGGVFMQRATCPGQDCVHAGTVRRDKESICCAPSGVLIVVRSGKEAVYDAVTK